MGYLPVMEFYLITRVQEEVRHSSLEKSQEVLQELIKD